MEQKYYLILGIIAILGISGLYMYVSKMGWAGTVITQTQNPDIPAEKNCGQDTDCACGVHIATRGCFYGNKNYVDASQQCPDFCSGITGNLVIKCVQGICKQVSI